MSGQKIDAPGQGARSLLDGRTQGPGGVPMDGGAAGGPGAPGVSQIDGSIDATGDGTRSLLAGSEQAGGPGVQGGPGESADGKPGQSMLEDEGASGGPGQSIAGEDGAGGPGTQGGPGAAGASGGPGQSPSGDDDDLDGDPLDESDSADDDDEDLVDPNDNRPDFGGARSGADDDEDDDLSADDLEDEFDEDAFDKGKAQKKKRKKSIDPAYVTVAVMSVIVLLIASVLYVGRDQLSGLWPGIEGLRLSQPQPVRIMKGGVQTLVVNGFVTNLTEEIKTVPDLKLMLIDEDNNIVQEATAPPTSPTINPNSTQPYRIELQLPNESAASLRVDWD
jgi:hypothetical protein